MVGLGAYGEAVRVVVVVGDTGQCVWWWVVVGDMVRVGRACGDRCARSPVVETQSTCGYMLSRL